MKTRSIVAPLILITLGSLFLLSNIGLLPPLPEWSAKAAGAVGALLVVIVGRWLEQRILARQDVTIV